MSYLVLARKWRPQRFDEVIGQPHVIRTLANAIQSNRVAHAYLFTGARGVGKTSVARILAKALNCERGISTTPCNECSNCREITQGNSLDVLEIDGASNRGIDNIRELRETVRYRPVKSSHKIYIIDEVHMLTTEAFNALLKTLEEPPKHVLFLFATTEPHKIPATIASRCQRFDFRRIPNAVVLAHLQKIVADEQADFSDVILYTVAQEADGSMRDAQSLLEQLLAFRNQDLSDDEILEVLGVMDRRSVYQAGQAILAGDVISCLEVIESIYQRGIDSKRFCQQLCDYFRNLLFLSLDPGTGTSWLDLPEEEKVRLRENLEKTSSETLHLYFQIMLQGEERIRLAAQPRIALEMLLLRMCRLPRLRALDDVLEQLACLESGCGAVAAMEAQKPLGAVPASSPRPPSRATAQHLPLQPSPRAVASSPAAKEGPAGNEPAPAADSSLETAEPVQPQAAAADWPDCLGWLMSQDPLLGAKLGQSRLHVDSDGRFHVQVIEIYEEVLREPATLSKLTNLLRQRYGDVADLVIEVAAAGNQTKRRAQAIRTQRKSSRRLAMEHPVVQQALAVLGGELMEIKDLEK